MRLPRPHGVGSSVAVRWTMVLVPVGTLAISAFLWRAVSIEERSRIEQMVAGEARTLARDLGNQLRFRTETVARRAQQWTVLDRATRADWDADVTRLRLLEPALEIMAWVQPDRQVRWISPPDTAVEFLPTSTDPGGKVSAALARARSTNADAVVGPLPLPDGDSGFVVIAPVVRGTEFAGHVIAFFDIPALLRDVVGGLQSGFGLAVLANGKEIYRRYAETDTAAEEWLREVVVEHDELSLTLRLWPTERTLAVARSALPRIVLVAGVSLAVVFTLLVRLGQITGLRAKEAQMTQDLQREVTARKRAERSLECWAHELARSNEEFERFAYAISHDLRAPLNSMIMNLQLLADRLGDRDQEAERYVDRVEAAVRRTSDMIEGLLAYALVSQTPERHKQVSTQRCLEDGLANLEVLVKESGAEITHDELPDVPGDAAKLTQLFQNLVGNAIKFCDDRGPRVHVGVERQDDEWLFAVSDNGVGIPEDQADRVFDLFWRGQDDGERPGKGIGLAICKRIVEGHGGRIWTEAGADGGTTFYFTLPTEPPADLASA